LGPCGSFYQKHGGPWGPSGLLVQAITNCIDLQCSGQC
jgi:hypothetical protein